MSGRNKDGKIVPFEGTPVVLYFGTYEQNMERIRSSVLDEAQLERNLRLAKEIEEIRLFREARLEAMKREQSVSV
ncbi:MAG: hypothetical protein LBN12_07265 [Clostridiales Family XIII bacterium]|jgi:hypothetical protein|nr:hypothetical protein [Clostridiales Family XIII bacterium]